MYCIFVLTKSSLKMFVRNRQALFFSLFMPLVILLIFGAMKFGGSSPITVGLVTHSPHAGTATGNYVENLRNLPKKLPTLTVKEGTLDEELAALKTGDRAAVLDVPDNLIADAPGKDPQPLTVYYNDDQPAQASMARSIVAQISDKMSLAMAQVPQLFSTQEESVKSHNLRYIDFLLPGVIAMSVMQMSVFSVAFVFAQYRERGILKRILATPVRPYQFVTANILARLTMSVTQAAIFTVVGVVFYHVQIQGQIWLLALCVLLGALMFLGLGFTISGLAKTIEAVPVYANLIVFPMLFLGNVFFPVNNVPTWLQPIAKNLPLTYFSRALRAVMSDGAGLMQIKWDILGTFLWAVILVTAATLVFRVQEPENA